VSSPAQRRRSGALGVSVALHALLGSVLLLLGAWSPDPRDPLPAPPSDRPVVYVMMEGPGGGGGGNPTPAPPRPVEIPKPTPVDPVPVIAEPVVLDEPPPLPSLQAPVYTNANVLQASGDSLVSLSEPGGGERGKGAGGGDGDGLGPGQDRGTGGGVFEPGVAGVTWPAVLYKAAPGYTTGALRSKIQGTVTIEAVVRVDGSVSDARIVGSLDPVHGLDQAALEAATRWRFKPASKDGRPVAVVVRLLLDFNLR
jgi:TonB family protein